MPHFFHILILLVIGLADFLVAALFWKRRSIPGAFSLLLLMIAAGAWTIVTAGEMATISIPGKILWSKTSYLFITSAAPLWFLFTLRYTHNDSGLTPLRHSLLWIVPAIVVALAVTNEWHHLIWTTITPSSPEPGASLIYGHGPGVWLDVFYSYILMLTGTILLLNVTLRSQAIFRFQTLAVIGAALIPWIGNFLYVAEHFTIWGMEPTPFAFSISGLLLMISLFRFRFFALTPIASYTLFENINSGVLVLDLQNYIVEANPAAQRYLNLGPSEIGRRLDTLSTPVLLRLSSIFESQPPLELFTEHPEPGLWLNVVISPLRHRETEMGKLIVLQDITERKRLEKEREEMIGSLEKALAEIKTLRGFIPICCHCKKIRTDEGFWQQIENYISEHSEVVFSHGVCPDCMEKFYKHLRKQ